RPLGRPSSTASQALWGCLTSHGRASRAYGLGLPLAARPVISRTGDRGIYRVAGRRGTSPLQVPGAHPWRFRRRRASPGSMVASPVPSPPPSHRPWGFPPAGERWRPISAVFPCNGGQTAHTPPLPASTLHGLPSPSSMALPEVLSPISRVPRCRGGCRANPILPLGPPSLGPPSPRSPLLRGLVAAPPSSGRSYDLSCQTQRHSPISRFAVIRRALPCGSILAGLSAAVAIPPFPVGLLMR